MLSIQRECGNGTKNTRKKRYLPQEKKTRVAIGAPAYRRTIKRRTGFNKSIKTKTKQKKTNVTPEKDVMTSASQTPGGYKFAPLVPNQQGRANQHEPACFGLSSSWPFSSRAGIRLHAALAFSAANNFAMKCSAPCSAVLRHSLSSWAAVVHWSALMPKARRSSRKHAIHFSPWPSTQLAPPTNSPNITRFGSLVSSMRATNPANKIRLLRKVASMLSFPVLISVSR